MNDLWYEPYIYTIEQIQSMTDRKQLQFADIIKAETFGWGKHKVTVIASRMTVEDGAPANNMVTVLLETCPARSSEYVLEDVYEYVAPSENDDEDDCDLYPYSIYWIPESGEAELLDCAATKKDAEWMVEAYKMSHHSKSVFYTECKNEQRQ